MSFHGDYFRQNANKRKNFRNSRVNKKRIFKSQENTQIYAKDITRRNSRLTLNAMSTWAENYTYAATWQLQHQTAYWKAKATALEYENRKLHQIICSMHLENGVENVTMPISPRSSNVTSEIESDDDIPQEPSEDELEVSEEYIQFLTSNHKYKEDARREREKFQNANLANDVTKPMEAGPVESVPDQSTTLKNLYGDKWQKISALETEALLHFTSECEKRKPKYWPNIPLNL